jgi:hypothetical protein
MKFNRNHLYALAIAGSLFTFAGMSRAQDDDTPPASQPAVSLEHEMEQMGREFKTIRNQLSDPSQNASTIAAVLELEQHTLAAKSAIPRAATTMPTAADNAAKLADFQATLLNVLRQELDLEEQLRANKNDEAAKTVASIRGLESDGHREFRRRRD